MRAPSERAGSTKNRASVTDLQHHPFNHMQNSTPLSRIRVDGREGNRAFWASETEATILIRLGMAHSYGTRNRVIGLRLTVDQRTAAARLWDNEHLDQPAGGLRTAYRQLVGGGYHAWTHRRLPNARTEATRRAALAA